VALHPDGTPSFTAAYFDQQGLYAFGRQPEAIHWDVVQLAIALAKWSRSKRSRRSSTPSPNNMSRRWPAMLKRLGVHPQGDETDLALVQAIETGLASRSVEIDRFFFDGWARRIRMSEIISFEPATGAELWRGATGDADTEVAIARAASAAWAARGLDERIAILRRFADVVRAQADSFADLIARETGKPLWEARTEVDSVIAKVDISIAAQAERTPKRRWTARPAHAPRSATSRMACLAVLGPYNFPAHLPNGHIVPALLAGNAMVFKPSEKTPASGAFLVDRCTKRACPRASSAC
jgi:hypothetical protein